MFISSNIGIPSTSIIILEESVDLFKLLESFEKAIDEDNHFVNFFSLVDEAPTIIKAEVEE